MHVFHSVCQNQFEFVHLAVLEALESRDTFYKMTDFERIFGSEKSYSKQQDTNLKKEFKVGPFRR